MCVCVYERGNGDNRTIAVVCSVVAHCHSRSILSIRARLDPSNLLNLEQGTPLSYKPRDI